MIERALASRSASRAATPGRSLDVLVLGGGPAAFATAALLGRRGLRGLLVDQGETLADPGHPRAWIFDPKRAPAIARVEEALGLQDAMRRSAVALRPGIRLVSDGPRGRPARRRAELEPEGYRAHTLARFTGLEAPILARSLPEVDQLADQFSAWLGDMTRTQPRSFLARRRWKAAGTEDLELLGPDPDTVPAPLRALASGLAEFLLAGTAGPELGRGAAARVLSAVLAGPRLPDGGRGIDAVLAERAERSGFELHTGRVRDMELRGRRFLVTTEGRRRTEQVDLVIDASAGLDALEVLPRGLVNRRLAPLLAASRPARHRARFGWRVDPDVLPEPLGRSALCLPGAAIGRPAWVSVTRRAPRALVEVEVVLGPGERGSDPRALAEASAGLLRHLAPFFDRGRPEPLETRVTPLCAPDPEDGHGVAGIGVETPIRNFLVAAPGAVLPGALEIDAALHAASQAAEIAARRLKA